MNPARRLSLMLSAIACAGIVLALVSELILHERLVALLAVVMTAGAAFESLFFGLVIGRRERP